MSTASLNEAHTKKLVTQILLGSKSVWTDVFQHLQADPADSVSFQLPVWPQDAWVTFTPAGRLLHVSGAKSTAKVIFASSSALRNSLPHQGRNLLIAWVETFEDCVKMGLATIGEYKQSSNLWSLIWSWLVVILQGLWVGTFATETDHGRFLPFPPWAPGLNFSGQRMPGCFEHDGGRHHQLRRNSGALQSFGTCSIFPLAILDWEDTL